MNDAENNEEMEVSVKSMTDDEIRAELLANDIKLHHKTGHDKLVATLEAVRAGTYVPKPAPAPKPGVSDKVGAKDSVSVQVNPAPITPPRPMPAMPTPAEMEEEDELPEEEAAPVTRAAPPPLPTLGHRPGAAKPQREEDLTPTQKAMRLVRIVVIPNDPLLATYPGLIFTVGSSRVNNGRMIKKFVPFGNEEGWHVPHIIYEQILHAEMQKFKTVKLPNGEKGLVPYISKKFNVQVLPPLTKAELQKLATAQKARQLA